MTFHRHTYIDTLLGTVAAISTLNPNKLGQHFLLLTHEGQHLITLFYSFGTLAVKLRTNGPNRSAAYTGTQCYKFFLVLTWISYAQWFFISFCFPGSSKYSCLESVETARTSVGHVGNAVHGTAFLNQSESRMRNQKDQAIFSDDHLQNQQIESGDTF